MCNVSQTRNMLCLHCQTEKKLITYQHFNVKTKRCHLMPNSFYKQQWSRISLLDKFTLATANILNHKAQHSNNYRSCKPMDKLCRKLPPNTSESTGVRTAWIQPVGMNTVWPCLMTALITDQTTWQHQSQPLYDECTFISLVTESTDKRKTVVNY